MAARAWVLLALVAPLGALAPADAAAATDPLAAAIAWLATQQGDKAFGYAAPAYVVEAIAQTGLDPKSWPTAERSAFSMMQPMASGPALGVYQSRARIAHAVGTSGYDPRDVGGHDYVADVRAGYVGSQADVLDDAWLILALRAAGVPADDEQVQRAALLLEASRASSGGWGISATSKAGTDATGMVVVALAAAGRDMAADARARAFLDGTRGPGGGHLEPANGFPENCQSTLWALHAYDAMGVAPHRETLSFLASLQGPDGRVRRYPAQTDDPGDAWCTAEAIVYLAGGRYPLPGYAPGTVDLPRAHALDAAALRVAGPYSRATWTFADAVVEGTVAERTFPRAGTWGFFLLAEGDGARWRTAGTVDLLGARPRLALGIASLETLRHETVTLPFAANDPDGSVAAVELSWGDGTRTSAAEHAYALPGRYTVEARARDATGYWSDVARATVDVANRAPTLAPLPARLVADRAAPLRLALSATDPEGDAVSIGWALGGRTGASSVNVTLTELGGHTLRIVATDAFGAQARADVQVEVRNLPPTIALDLPAEARAGQTLTLTARAADPDGPLPKVRWTVGELVAEGASISLALPAGEHRVVANALDGDGDAREAVATLVVRDDQARAPDAPPAPEAPRILRAAVEAAPWGLRVQADVEPPTARLVLRWGDVEMDVRDGEVVAWPDGADEISGLLVARHDGLDAEVAWGPVRRGTPPLPPLAFEAPALEVRACETARIALRPHEAPEYRFDLGDGWGAWGDAREAAVAWATPGVREIRAQARDGARVAEASMVVRVVAEGQPDASAPLEATAATPDAPAAAPPVAELLTEASPAPRPVPGAAVWTLALAMALAARLGTRARSGRR